MKQIKAFALLFLTWTAIGMLFKLPFVCLYLSHSVDIGIGDYFEIVYHGLPLDFAVAGYVSIIPGLMLLCSLWYDGKTLRYAWRGYIIIASILSSVAYVSNLALYGYWGFPLDSTPLLYIRTSPADAIASISVWQLSFILVVMVAVVVAIFFVFTRYAKALKKHSADTKQKKAGYTAAILLLTVALIIPIRGGFSTGTNHTGTVYFSDNTRVNHAAVNPIFSFIESVLHMEEIGSRYRFMTDAEAAEVFSSMVETNLREDAVERDWNVVLICLESFSKSIMAEGGMVEGVVPNLERYTKEGLYFDNIYANSFRTDRALVAVLSSLPAQPTMSVMDIPRISTLLPSMARTLRDAGYSTHFYYGGDTDYSNMKSYIMGTGFANITEQKDFSSDLVTGKWGVADGPVYDAALNDIVTEMSADSAKRFYKVIMTGSSHEPFDVPDYNHLPSPELNAFSYADDCLGRFVERLKQLPYWKNTLVVIVPDHLGAYPREVDNYQLSRYAIPLVMIGGVIESARRCDVVGSQIDISATVLAMLGRSHEEFVYSKDLLDSIAPHFAFFSFPDAMGIVDTTGVVIYDNTSGQVAESVGENATALTDKAQAYLQKLYDDLDSRNKEQANN